MGRLTLSREGRLHPPGTAGFGQAARARVLARIRRALAEGDEAGALRIARELERRFDAAAARDDRTGRIRDRTAARA